MDDKNFDKVNVSDSVKLGKEIALTGNSGSGTGPHLHMEAQVKNEKSWDYYTVKKKEGEKITDGSSSASSVDPTKTHDKIKL